MTTKFKQVDFIKECKLPSTRGGAGRGQGRKKGEETVRIRVPASKLDLIQTLLNNDDLMKKAQSLINDTSCCEDKKLNEIIDLIKTFGDYEYTHKKFCGFGTLSVEYEYLFEG